MNAVEMLCRGCMRSSLGKSACGRVPSKATIRYHDIKLSTCLSRSGEFGVVNCSIKLDLGSCIRTYMMIPSAISWCVS